MKFIVQWTIRDSGEAEDRLEDGESLLKAFSSWTPPSSWTIESFVTRIDGRGGMMIIETDDAPSMAMSVAQYNAWLEYEIIPVLDIAEGVGLLPEARAWAKGAMD